MKKNLTLMLLVVGRLTFGTTAFHDFNLIAPIVSVTSNAPSQIGSIVYETASGAFYGYGVGGSWIKLSGPGPNYVSADQTITTCSYPSWCTVGSSGSVTLGPGAWRVSGFVDFNVSNLNYVEAAWTASDGPSPTGLTIQAGALLTQQTIPSQNRIGFPVGDVRINVVSGTQTVYLLPAFTVSSSPTITGITTHIWAERIQ